MKCPLLDKSTGGLAFDRLTARVDAGPSTPLARHIAECPACQAFRTEHANLLQLMDAWEEAPVSPDFNRRLWRRIDALPNRLWHWRPGLALGAAALVVAGGLMLEHRSRIAIDVVVSGGEADLVEQVLDDLQLLHQFDLAQNR